MNKIEDDALRAVSQQLTDDPYMIDRKIAEARGLRAKEMGRMIRALFAALRLGGQEDAPRTKALRGA